MLTFTAEDNAELLTTANHASPRTVGGNPHEILDRNAAYLLSTVALIT